jgi:hypothetical protein
MDDKGKGEKKKSIGTMDIILIIVGIALLVFTVTMVELFKIYGSVPDTLITCVFACLGGECGIMGWIKTNKDKRKDREWKLEDEDRAKTDLQHQDDDLRGGE